MRAPIVQIAVLVALCSCDDTQRSGDSADADAAISTAPPAGCRASCDDDIGTPNCEVVQPLDADLQSIADVWGASETCGTAIISAVIGECADGTDFIFHSTGHTSEVRYFSDAGEFIALATGSDSIERTCLGQSYWPTFVDCQQPVVTEEALCGNPQVGDPVRLPWSADVNADLEAFFNR